MEERARRALQAALPAYEVESELGRGAFGIVYAARHTQLGREVAVKVLPQVFAVDETVRGRFVAEAQMVASLDHPHIVPVYDYVEDENACMLIMERCSGSVGDRFKEHGIATDEACAAVLACLAALDLAHSRSVLHRDVKPENLMFDMKGTVKLADFGIARALDDDVRRTKTGMVVGTPAYMSPEQIRGDELTGASDVYSVAIMAYELLTGALPFPVTPSVNGLLAHHLTTEPLPMLSTRPELPRSVGAVVDRALSKSLEDRHGTADEFATELSAACVRSFGSGWLRRRGFTLHWPDMVAENERPRSGESVTTTGTITVHAMSEPHEVIGPADALDDSWADTLLGRRALAPDETPTLPNTPSPPANTPPATPVPPTPPASPTPPATPTGAPPPAAPTRSVAAADSSSKPSVLVWMLGGAAALIVLAIAAFVLIGGSDDDNQAAEKEQSGSTVAASPSETGDPAPASAVPTIEAEPDPEPAETATTVSADDPDAETPAGTTLPVVLPIDDPADFSNQPETYDPSDASTAVLPTPCPDGPEKVACIYTGAATNEATDVINVSFFTRGFIPELEPAGDSVHFYFDTEVDGDEAAAGENSAVPRYRAWDQPFVITEPSDDSGRPMFTVSEAQATDARYLCVIVADPAGNAIPGTGNCAPVVQTWDPKTRDQQLDRLLGVWAGRCAIGVTAIIPDDSAWGSADLVDNTPAAVGAGFEPVDDRGEAGFQQLVDNGGVIYAIGPLDDSPQLSTVTFSRIEGPGFRIGSNPTQVGAGLAALGVDRGDTTEELIGGRMTLTSTTTFGDKVIKRYFISDFDYVIEMNVTAPAGTDLTLADQIAHTVVGC